MKSSRAAPPFRLHRRARRNLPNDLNPDSGDQRDRSDNRIRQLMTAGARHRNGDQAIAAIYAARAIGSAKSIRRRQWRRTLQINGKKARPDAYCRIAG